MRRRREKKGIWIAIACKTLIFLSKSVSVSWCLNYFSDGMQFPKDGSIPQCFFYFFVGVIFRSDFGSKIDFQTFLAYVMKNGMTSSGTLPSLWDGSPETH